jgi:hypothetical protein
VLNEAADATRKTYGNVAWHHPKRLRLNQTGKVTFVLSATQTPEELKKKIGKIGARARRKVELTRVMRATLDGDGFDIELVGHEEDDAKKLVNPTQDRWSWWVKPTGGGGGVRELTVTLTGFYRVDGERLSTEIDTFETTMTIRVIWHERARAALGDHWQWLFTTVLVPLGYWGIRRRRRGAPPEQPAQAQR